MKSFKKNEWRQFLSSIGKEIKLGDIWSMIKMMSEKRKSVRIPVLIGGDHWAITNKGRQIYWKKCLQENTMEVI